MRSNYVTDRSCWQCGRGYVHCRPPRPATGTNLNCAVLWEGRWHAMADQRLLPRRRKTVSDRKAVCAREAYRRRARHGWDHCLHVASDQGTRCSGGAIVP